MSDTFDHAGDAFYDQVERFCEFDEYRKPVFDDFTHQFVQESHRTSKGFKINCDESKYNHIPF